MYTAMTLSEARATISTLPKPKTLKIPKDTIKSVPLNIRIIVDTYGVKLYLFRKYINKQFVRRKTKFLFLSPYIDIS